jgi:hypothetical protein
MGRERTEGERRAAEEFANAVRIEAERFFEAVVEEVRRNPEGIRLRPSATLAEEEADRLALDVVHRAREELEEGSRVTIFRPPGAADAELWAENRELGRETRNRTWKPPRLP